MILDVKAPPQRLMGFSDCGCRVTGNPLTTDPSPNVTPPAASRILTIKYDERANSALHRLGSTGQNSITYLLESAVNATINVSHWFFDATLGLWVRYGVAGIAVAGAFRAGTAGCIQTVNESLPILPGISWFPQITAVTGSVTAFGYMFN